MVRDGLVAADRIASKLGPGDDIRAAREVLLGLPSEVADGFLRLGFVVFRLVLGLLGGLLIFGGLIGSLGLGI